MKRKILNISMVIVIFGIIIVSLFIFKSGRGKLEITSKDNGTTQAVSTGNSSLTPVPTENKPSPTPAVSPTIEPDSGEILSGEKVDLDGDGIDEDVQIEKVKVNSGSQEYSSVLVIKGKTGTMKIPFLTRSENSPLGAFTNIEFNDLDGDGIKDVFITIPDAGPEFSISYFFAYNYKKQKAYSFQSDNVELLRGLIDSFKFSYSGKGLLNIKSDSFNFKTDINIKDNANYSDSESLNKSTYDKAWISENPIDLDQNSKLILTQDNENKELVKIPFPIFGQAISDILGEIDTYVSFNNEFKPVLKKFEVLELHGSEKKLVGTKVVK